MTPSDEELYLQSQGIVRGEVTITKDACERAVDQLILDLVSLVGLDNASITSDLLWVTLNITMTEAGKHPVAIADNQRHCLERLDRMRDTYLKLTTQVVVS